MIAVNIRASNTFQQSYNLHDHPIQPSPSSMFPIHQSMSIYVVNPTTKYNVAGSAHSLNDGEKHLYSC